MSYLKSISDSLASTHRESGPSVTNIKTNEIYQSNNNPQSDFAKKNLKIGYNLTPAELYEYALQEEGTIITKEGALAAYSGVKTGRSPKDKRIVYDDMTEDIWWEEGSPNIKMDKNTFLINRESAIDYLNNLDKVFIFDGFAGWDKNHRLKVRVISERAYHSLFMHNMLIRPSEEELANFGEPDYTIYNAGKFPCNRYTGYMTSSTSIDFDFTRKEIIILGTQYAGEMKKGIFTVMHFLMPLRGVLSLHSSANENKEDGSVSIFFGLSGTGKTTLSADPARLLIGDDEHCWTNDGIFNIEGGCYAKCIDLSPHKEPEIYDAIKFGALLENVKVSKKREIDFSSAVITQNTRLSYPIHFIKNAKKVCTGVHAKNIILLTCDAFGILPPVSKLNKEQAMYYFISGYTSKIAGTEDGINEPEATFSSCFGEAFIVHHPLVYAKMLAEKMEEHNTNAWLINTGWIDGKYGEGSRCPLKYTRAIVDVINNGTLQDEEFYEIDNFKLAIPKKCKNVDPNILNPRNLWKDKEQYDKESLNLALMFKTNFDKYSLPNIEKYGPVITQQELY